MEERQRRKHRPEDLRACSKANVQPVADDRVHDKAAGERVEGEQRRQPGKHTRRLASPKGAERRRAHVGFGSPADECRDDGGRHAERRIKKEEDTQVGEAREASGQTATRVEEAPDQRVAAKSQVALLWRRDLGHGRLLDRSERSEVQVACAEHPGHTGQDEQRRLRRKRQVEAGDGHQQTGHSQRRAAAESHREYDCPQPGQRRGGEAETHGEADQHR